MCRISTIAFKLGGAWWLERFRRQASEVVDGRCGCRHVLRLDQQVFGEGSLLGDRYGSASQFADPRVNDTPNWWHTGGVPGTSSLLVRTADRYGPSGHEEFTWAAITNSTNAPPQRNLDLDALMWQLVASVKTWPQTDLF